MGQVQYSYLRIQGEGFGGRFFSGIREAIDQKAAEGWRYCGFVPVYQNRHGAYDNIDLIFEKEKTGDGTDE